MIDALQVHAAVALGSIWPVAIVGPYLAVGLLAAVVAVLTSGNPLRTANMTRQDHTAHAAQRAAAQTVPRLSRARARGMALLLGCAVLTAWPVVLRRQIFIARLRPKDARVFEQLQPGDSRVSVFLLMVALAILGLRLVSGQAGVVTAAAYAVMISLVAHQVFNSLPGTKLAQRLRKAIRPPYVVFAVIAMSDFLTLVAVAMITHDFSAAHNFKTSWIWTEPRNLVALHHVTAIFAHRQSPATVILGIAALAYFASTVSQLARWQDFRRTADDRAAVADAFLTWGDDRAEDWLERAVTDPTRGAHTVQVQGRFALNEGEFDSALMFARTNLGLEHARLHTAPDSIDEAYAWLFSSFTPALDLENDDRWNIIRRAVVDGVSDACMTTLVAKMKNLYHPDWDAGARLQAVDVGLTVDHYPLTLAMAEHNDYDPDRTLERLDAASPSSMPDKMLHATMIAYVQTVRAAQTDPRPIHSIVRSLADELSQVAEDDLPYWLRSTITEQLVNFQFAALSGDAPNFELAAEIYGARLRLLNLDSPLAWAYLESQEGVAEALAGLA